MLHVMTYSISLNLWNGFDFYYLLLFFLQEIPNVFAFMICSISFLDLIPDWLDTTTVSQIMKIIYYFKPFIDLIAFLTIIIENFPLVFALFLWNKGDDDSQVSIAQNTLTESLISQLPYILSLVFYSITMQYINSDLGLKFAPNLSPY